MRFNRWAIGGAVAALTAWTAPMGVGEQYSGATIASASDDHHEEQDGEGHLVVEGDHHEDDGEHEGRLRVDDDHKDGEHDHDGHRMWDDDHEDEHEDHLMG